MQYPELNLAIPDLTNSSLQESFFDAEILLLYLSISAYSHIKYLKHILEFSRFSASLVVISLIYCVNIYFTHNFMICSCKIKLFVASIKFCNFLCITFKISYSITDCVIFNFSFLILVATDFK